MNYAIETNHLTKNYNKFCAVKELNINVKSGEIYAFLGLNGAGKTTTIRTILGMIRPSNGNVKVLNQVISQDGRGPWDQVGYLVESATAYPELSVRENLDVARRLHGIKNPKVVDEVMEQLVITSYADRKAGTLSSGNFQRLGLARALLHKPQLLILDEPTNALDPAGVVEIRNLLLTLANEYGTTIFMSSHILSEVDKLANRIGIIHKGVLIEELDTERLEKIRTKQLVIETHDLSKAHQALKSFEIFKVSETRIGIKDPQAIQSPDMIAIMLVQAGTAPLHLAVEQEDLEEHFLKLTAN